MLSDTFWDNAEQSILHIQFSGEWDTEAFQESIKAAHQLIAQQNHPVCLISSFDETVRLPRGLLGQLYRMQFANPDNQTMHIYVTNTPALRSLFSVLQRISMRKSVRIRIANSIEDARQICQQG